MNRCNFASFFAADTASSLSTISSAPVLHTPRECSCTVENIWLDIILAVEVSNSMTQNGLNEVAFLFSNSLILLHFCVSVHSAIGIFDFASITIHNCTQAKSGLPKLRFRNFEGSSKAEISSKISKPRKSGCVVSVRKIISENFSSNKYEHRVLSLYLSWK